jgi:hypothetical protein
MNNGADGAAITVDAVGNVVFGGSLVGSVNFGGTNLISQGGQDAFVVKLDKSGNHLWSQRFGDASDQTVTAVAVDAQGNVFIAGWFRGNINFGGMNLQPADPANNTNVFVASFDPAGNYRWSKSFGANMTVPKNGFTFPGAGLGGIAVDAMNNVLISGNFPLNIDFGKGLLTQSTVSMAGNSMFVAKLRGADGSGMWSNAYFGATANNTQTPEAVAVDSKGNVVVVGLYNADLVIGTNSLPAGSQTAFVAKFDASGGVTWASPTAANGTLANMDVAVDSMDRLIVTHPSGSNLILEQLGSDGSTLWTKSFADSALVLDPHVAVEPNDDILLTGRFTPTINLGGGTLMAAPTDASLVSDAFLARFTSGGQHAWSRSCSIAAGPFSIFVHGTPPEMMAILTEGGGDFGTGPTTAGLAVGVVKASP